MSALLVYTTNFFPLAVQGITLESYSLREQHQKGPSFSNEANAFLGNFEQICCAVLIIIKIFGQKFAPKILIPPLTILLISRSVSYFSPEGSLPKIIAQTAEQFVRLTAKMVNFICAAILFQKKMSRAESLFIALHIFFFSLGLTQEIYWSRMFFEEKGQVDMRKLRIRAPFPPIGENLL